MSHPQYVQFLILSREGGILGYVSKMDPASRYYDQKKPWALRFFNGERRTFSTHPEAGCAAVDTFPGAILFTGGPQTPATRLIFTEEDPKHATSSALFLENRFVHHEPAEGFARVPGEVTSFNTVFLPRSLSHKERSSDWTKASLFDFVPKVPGRVPWKVVPGACARAPEGPAYGAWQVWGDGAKYHILAHDPVSAVTISGLTQTGRTYRVEPVPLAGLYTIAHRDESTGRLLFAVTGNRLTPPEQEQKEPPSLRMGLLSDGPSLFAQAGECLAGNVQFIAMPALIAIQEAERERERITQALRNYTAQSDRTSNRPRQKN